MITKNEEKQLAQCLDAVKDIVSEIIIVDTGSTDSTKKIAQKYTNAIIDFDWADDFSKARNVGLEKAKEDWILVLDADEILDDSGKEKIKELTSKEGIDGFSFQQLSYIKDPAPGCKRNVSSFALGKPYNFLIKKHLVRLFRNNKDIAFKHRVHEVVEDSMREKNLVFERTEIALHHLGSVKGEEITNEKKDFYSNLILKQLEDDPQSARYNYYAARYYMSVGDFESALSHFTKTAKINPHYKLVHSDIAKVYMKTNDLDNAIEHFRKSWKLNEDNPSPANNLAVLLMHKKDFSQAKEVLEAQMVKNPENNALKINYQQLLKEIEGNRKHIAS